jgi:anti-sigma B factor antagonist
MAEYRYCLHGGVDVVTVPRLRSDLLNAIHADGAHLLVDCTNLTFIDSSGIAVLLEANERLEADGRHLLILNVPRGPRRAFDALGLAHLLRYERDSASY